MNIKKVHRVEIADLTPAKTDFGPVRYIVQILFSKLALRMMTAAQASATATKIALNLTRLERVNMPGNPGPWTHTRMIPVDLDTLGAPVLPDADGTGTKVWVVKSPEGSIFSQAVRDSQKKVDSKQKS
jgi:hypothetical protein